MEWRGNYYSIEKTRENTKILYDRFLNILDKKGIIYNISDIRPQKDEKEFIERPIWEEIIKHLENKEIIEKLIKHGGELLETFIIFVESNSEKQITSNKLHIHRNTLAYRISKIEELTGLNFNKAIDCYRLTGAYLYYKVIYSNAQ